MPKQQRKSQQQLPSKGVERERLRAKGQFWTPAWVAEAMVHYALGNGARELFDPAVGEGAFLRAGHSVAAELGRSVRMRGCEVDPAALTQARDSGLPQSTIRTVALRDFLKFKPSKRLAAIVGNPPYIRHHRLPAAEKRRLHAYARSVIGASIDGRAGYHVYFLIHALTLLASGGRLSFIMPADVAEGVFAPALWNWIAKHFRIDAVIAFAPDATPFPGVDTNAIVVMLQRSTPQSTLQWVYASKPECSDLARWVRRAMTPNASRAVPRSHALTAARRSLAETLATGLSRPPQAVHRGPTLGQYARVMRGIAPGATDFFFMTQRRARELGLTSQWLLPAIGRTRDVPAGTQSLTSRSLRALDAAGRPTVLLSPDGRALNQFPPNVRAYIRKGQGQGLHRRALIRTRSPWWKMEVRAPPAFLFAYLGRRNQRFIRNQAGVVPLTGFLCVYPRVDASAGSATQFAARLFSVLSHPKTLANLGRVGKSYGSGALKVEPRALERLPLPLEVVRKYGLCTKAKTPRSRRR